MYVCVCVWGGGGTGDRTQVNWRFTLIEKQQISLFEFIDKSSCSMSIFNTRQISRGRKGDIEPVTEGNRETGRGLKTDRRGGGRWRNTTKDKRVRERGRLKDK